MPKIYKVGGIVRDEILGIKSNDIDYVFVLDDPNTDVDKGFAEMIKWMKKEKFKIFLVTKNMFTVRAVFPEGSENDGVVADFVMARKELGYEPTSRKPIIVPGTLYDDLVRRDFTVNAMCKDESDVLIDMFGGLDDLKKGVLRTPTDPKITMMDDPLRILRAIRFSITKGFSIDGSIFEAAKNPEVLKKFSMVVSVERTREEIMKMMKFDTKKTMKTLIDIDSNEIPGLLDIVFSKDLWLKPTTEKKDKKKN